MTTTTPPVIGGSSRGGRNEGGGGVHWGGEEGDDDAEATISAATRRLPHRRGSEADSNAKSTRLHPPNHDDNPEWITGEREVQDEVDEKKVASLNEKMPLDRQLFLTGVASTATEADLRHFFTRFGPVTKVFIVKDKVTQHPSGSVFLHFRSDQHAAAAFEYAQQQSRELATAEKQSILAQQQQEAAAGGLLSRHKEKSMLYAEKHGQKFTMKDPFVMLGATNRVSVHKVVSRMEAEEKAGQIKKKKTEDAKVKRTKTGSEEPRNLYLLQEGHIVPGTPAADELPPRYLNMLQASYDQRRQQLRNVNMFVSRTRLSIRNLPRHLKEPDVRKMLLKVVRKYYKLHPDELDRERFGKHGPMKNLTILTDTRGVSKGFGFVEFVDHGAALHVLRQLNNNPTVFGPHHRLIISFSIENMNAIQKLARIRELREMRRKREPLVGGRKSIADLETTGGGDEEVEMD